MERIQHWGLLLEHFETVCSIVKCTLMMERIQYQSLLIRYSITGKTLNYTLDLTALESAWFSLTVLNFTWAYLIWLDQTQTHSSLLGLTQLYSNSLKSTRFGLIKLKLFWTLSVRFAHTWVCSSLPELTQSYSIDGTAQWSNDLMTRWLDDTRPGIWLWRIGSWTKYMKKPK